ncbi:MAG: WbqC family protein [Candidatus Methylacidiphilales bacterium]|nr:WbqC family protein [Candidatus Methylacidiphilales bacterium]
MAITVVINQPTYLPWIGYFEQIRRADTFVFLDSVQFARSSFHHRNRIKNARDEAFWLSIPVKSCALETEIKDIEICNKKDWADKHLKSLVVNLGKAPHFAAMMSILEPRLHNPPTMLAELTTSIIKDISHALGLHAKFRRSSELPAAGQKADLVLSILSHLGATHYYSAAGSTYLEDAREKFAEAGIPFAYQTWEHTVYPQAGKTFTSHLSIVDAFCWVGPEGVRKMIGAEAPASTTTL